MGIRGQGHVYKRKGSPYWWIKFYVNTRPVFESSRSEKEQVAARLLRKRLDEVEKGTYGTAESSGVTVGDLLDDLLRNYRIHKRKSFGISCRPVVEANLRPYFGKLKPTQVTTRKLEEYREKRQKEGRSDSTVNREFALLRRAFYLGKKATPPKVHAIPSFPMVSEKSKVRRGFIEPEQYRAILAELPADIAPIVTIDYHIGCRKSELLELQWDQVDLLHGRIRFWSGTTKNDKGRTAPIFGEMRPTLQALLSERNEKWPKCRWVFSRQGKRIKDFRESWDEAAKRAGCEGSLFHDLRRSAVRNLIRAGVPEKIAMQISGHETRAIFDRYNIVDERDLQQAGEKVAKYLDRSVTTTVTMEREESPKWTSGKVM
jgi:integrase